MEKVTLPQAARQAIEAKLDGRKIPDPNSQAFDDLLEELRELNPDVYTELQTSLTYKSDPLPVEQEAKFANRRAKRQAFRDKLTNRRTHDNKTVPDKRKLFIVGSSLAMAFFGWMTWSTGIAPLLFGSGGAGAQQPDDTPVATNETNSRSTGNAPDQPFGVTAPQAQFASLTIPTAAPPAVAPATDYPPTSLQAERVRQPSDTNPDESEETTSSTDLPPRDTSDMPSDPTPVTRQAESVPSNPYQPPTAATTATPGESSATPDALPESLSFASQQESAPLLSTLSGESTPAQSSTNLAGVPLSNQEAQQTSNQPASSTLSLAATDRTPNAPSSTLSWEEPSPNQAETTLTSTAQVLPPVPAVGQEPTATNTNPAPQQNQRPQPINLQRTLSTGTELTAELVTAVAATGTQGTPVLAKTTGNWCQTAPCPEITWIGEATYDGTDRVNITFAEAVVGRNQQSVTATAFGDDRLPGIVANIGDGAPTAVQDLLRSSVGGASDYLNAINTRTTTTIVDGVVVQETADPDLGNVLLGRAASLFSLPADQTSVVRYASLPEGQALTVMFGISL